MHGSLLSNKLELSDVIAADIPELIALARKVTELNVFPTLSDAGREAIRQAQAKDTANIVNHEIYKAIKVKIDDRLVAFIAWRNGYYLAQLFVDPEYQGKGIGTCLLDEFVKRAERTHLEVRSSINAVDFYRKYGFVPTGEAAEVNNIRFVPMAYWVRE
jgi:GNAT superfamily N-acetyltransferase